jgi:hypothetical protein
MRLPLYKNRTFSTLAVACGAERGKARSKRESQWVCRPRGVESRQRR